jgi:hypothetical protein
MREELLHDLRLASIRTASLRRGAVLTLLLSVFALTATAAGTLHFSELQGSIKPAALAAGMFDGIAALTAGLAVCVLFYAAYAGFEAILSRRKLRRSRDPLAN